ncbi:MAG: hypothetical protein K8R76_09285 [Candidatus Aegiribacteria sp.]|nr:hypothetical protein [Candidatus Aegiribacteria sp.]
MRKAFFLNLLFISLLCAAASCGWSSKQKEVLSAFNSTIQCFEDADWNSAADMVSCSTMDFLDTIAEDLEQQGLTEYTSGSDLLSVMYNEYINLNGNVTTIFVQGNKATVTVSSMEYTMLLEDGIWKLDLEQLCRNGLDRAFEGSYFKFVEHGDIY